MAILFDWYENPQPGDKQDGETTLHPRIHFNGSTTTADLRRYIQSACTLTETDVSAVLDAVSHFMGRELNDGRQVHLDGLGYFRPVLGCDGTVTPETKRKSTMVKLKNIDFRPDKRLLSEVGFIKVKPLKQRSVLRKKLTAKDVDKKLADYFDGHDFMKRSDFQSLCNMTRTTATRYIRQLCDAGKLENEGTIKQPIYVLKKK